MAITQGQNANASDFVSTSSGAADSGKVAKLDANGQLLKAFLQYKNDVQAFTADGTWTKPSFGSMAIIELWGAGASGGVAKDNTVPSNQCTATGGGGGEYRMAMIPLAMLPATVAVTVGTGGVAVSRGTAGATNGNDGEDTTFGAYGTAKGGDAGLAAIDSSDVIAGGPGGTGGAVPFVDLKSDAGAAGGQARGGFSPVSASAGGDNDYAGAGGGSAGYYTGTAPTSATSAGGTSTEGGNGGAGAFNANGVDGASKGGGGGASISDNGTTYSSGKGGDGYARITVF